MKHQGDSARPLSVQPSEANKVSSVSAHNLSEGFYAINLTCLSLVDNIINRKFIVFIIASSFLLLQLLLSFFSFFSLSV